MLRGIIRHLGIPLGIPVTITHAGAGTDHQNRFILWNQCIYTVFVLLADGDVPLQTSVGNPQRFRKSKQTVHYMLAAVRRYLVVVDQPLQIFGAGTVKAQPNIGVHQAVNEAGAQGHLHVQQGIEAPSFQLPADGSVSAPAL